MFSFPDALDLMDMLAGDNYYEIIATDDGLVYVFVNVVVDMTDLDTGVTFYTGADADASYDYFMEMVS